MVTDRCGAKGVSLLPYRQHKAGGLWVGGFNNWDDLLCYGVPRPNAIFGKPDDADFEVHERVPAAYYGGIIFPYYGHFLLETLSTAPNLPSFDVPVIYHTLAGNFPSWAHDIFTLSNIVDNVVVVRDKPVSVDLLMPLDHTNVINSEISRRFISWANNVGDKVNGAGADENLYVSRRYCGNARVKNEDEIERFFLSRGWRVFYPEKHSVIDQIKVFKGAKNVVAIEGSALHTLIFCRQKIDLYVIARRKRIAHNLLLQFSRQSNINMKVAFLNDAYANDFKSESAINYDLFLDFFGGF